MEIKESRDFKAARQLVKSAKLSPEYLDEAEVLIVFKENRGKIIGCLGLERRGGRVYLQSLAVVEEKRRQGIGRSLVNYAFDNYCAKGDVLIALTLFWNNKFYYSLGFERLDAQEIKKADDIASRLKHRYCTAFGKVKN